MRCMQNTVRSNQKGIQCDDCQLWTHAACVSMSNNTNDNIQNTSNLWFCENCCLPGQSTSFFTSNPFSLLGDTAESIPSDTSNTSVNPESPFISSQRHEHSSPSINLSPGLPLHTSSPTCPHTKNPEHISVLQLNFNSLKSTTKTAELNTLISDHDPDIIIGCESKLDNTHATYAIFPDDYTVFRHDRDKYGGGVLIAVRTCLNPSPKPSLDGYPNQIWCSISAANGKKVIIGSAYRPPSDSAEDLEELNASLNHIFSRRKAPYVLLAGDLNCSGVQWNDELTDPTIADTCPDNIKDKLVTITSRYGLIQHQTDITRPESSSCLDLTFSNHHALIQNVHTTPGMSDHLAVKYKIAINIKRSAVPKRRIYDHRKADIGTMRQKMETFASKFAKDWDKYSPEENWNRFHSTLTSVMPFKTLRSKRHLPWINGSVRKQMSRRDRLFKKRSEVDLPDYGKPTSPNATPQHQPSSAHTTSMYPTSWAT